MFPKYVEGFIFPNWRTYQGAFKAGTTGTVMFYHLGDQNGHRVSDRLGVAIRNAPKRRLQYELTSHELAQFTSMAGLLVYLSARCPRVPRSSLKVLPLTALPQLSGLAAFNRLVPLQVNLNGEVIDE